MTTIKRLGRIRGIPQERLHSSLEDYFQTKVRLFTELLPASDKKQKCAVLNWDDSYGQEIGAQLTGNVLRCGSEQGLDYRALAVESHVDGTRATIQTPDGNFPIQSMLIGSFNLQNILVSVASCHGLGISLHQIAEGIENLKGVPGRLEPIVNERALHIFVDYAHTPDALRCVLEALRPFVESKARLITVFGCGGDRDREKRPLMGNNVARLSDVTIVTSDNPRTEDPQAIIAQIIPGIRAERAPIFNPKSRRGYLVEVDRRQAIRKAIEVAQPADLVLIAGKGHEDYQILGTEKVHFDDREEVLAACETLP